jgi:hypothetical protein
MLGCWCQDPEASGQLMLVLHLLVLLLVVVVTGLPWL